MVKKLFKHEMYAYAWLMFPALIILCGIALAHRIVQCFESDTLLFDILIICLTLSFVVTFAICSYAASIFALIRFYKHLFTGEGYLTLTLPVSMTGHIGVKLAAAMIWECIGALGCTVSICILLAGDALAEVGKCFPYLANQLYGVLGNHTFAFAAELFFILLMLSIYGHLLTYTCIAVGQLARKRRIFVAIAVYYGLYLVSQVVSTVIVAVTAALGAQGALDSLLEAIEQHPFATAHVVAGILFVASLIGASVCFFVTRYIMSRKLNLE